MLSEQNGLKKRKRVNEKLYVKIFDFMTFPHPKGNGLRTVYESLIQVLDFQISTVYFYLEENSITSSINIILCLGSALLTNDGGINKVGSGQVNLEIFAKLKIIMVLHVTDSML